MSSQGGSGGSGRSGSGGNKGPNIQGIAGELLKRAVTLGAGAYVSAEDKVTKTLNTVQAPIHISKNVMSELIDSFLKSYSLQVTAKIDFVRRDEKSESKKESKNKESKNAEQVDVDLNLESNAEEGKGEKS